MGICYCTVYAIVIGLGNKFTSSQPKTGRLEGLA